MIAVCYFVIRGFIRVQSRHRSSFCRGKTWKFWRIICERVTECGPWEGCEIVWAFCNFIVAFKQDYPHVYWFSCTLFRMLFRLNEFYTFCLYVYLLLLAKFSSLAVSNFPGESSLKCLNATQTQRGAWETTIRLITKQKEAKG